MNFVSERPLPRRQYIRTNRRSRTYTVYLRNCNDLHYKPSERTSHKDTVTQAHLTICVYKPDTYTSVPYTNDNHIALPAEMSYNLAYLIYLVVSKQVMLAYLSGL
jgi:ABC-type uncharacterized transport system substrate-binding protein